MIDERFSFKEFSRRGEDSPEARKLMEELQNTILLGARKVAEDSMSGIITRLKGYGIELTASPPEGEEENDSLDLSWSASIDDYRLGLGVDLNTTAGFPDLNKEVEWGHEAIPKDSRIYAAIAPIALNIQNYVCDKNFPELSFYIRNYSFERDLRNPDSALHKKLYDSKWMKSAGKGRKAVKEFFDSCNTVEIALEKVFVYSAGRHWQMSDRLADDRLLVRAYYFDPAHTQLTFPLSDEQKKEEGIRYLSNAFTRYDDGWVLDRKLF